VQTPVNYTVWKLINAIIEGLNMGIEKEYKGKSND